MFTDIIAEYLLESRWEFLEENVKGTRSFNFEFKG